MNNILKSWKTTAVGLTKIILGLSLMVMWYLGKIDIKSAVAGLVLVNYIGGVVSDMLTKDSDQTHSDN